MVRVFRMFVCELAFIIYVMYRIYICLGANELRKSNGDQVEKHINNDEFEKLTSALIEHIYELMVAAGLKKIYVPIKDMEILNFVFATKSNFQNTKKLLLFVNGSGEV